MALSIGDRAVRPLTADEAMRMVEAGILSEEEPVELLCGALTEKAVKSPAHEAPKARLITWLAPAVAAGCCTFRVEAPLIVPDRTSLPEPDIAMMAPGEIAIGHPSTALLVIEVAVTSVGVDATIKPALYAAAGVPELWVVDVGGRRVRVFRDPHGSGYATETTVTAPGSIAPLAVDVPGLDLAVLFAGL
jgi:Uma2 family endonuclease